MKFTAISCVITPIILAGITTSTRAQAPDYLCFWQQPDGTIRNLNSLCGSSLPQKLVSTDEAFLANFQSFANRYSASINQVLKSELARNQENLIAEAKTVCRVLNFGGLSAEKTRRRAMSEYDPTPAGNAKRDVISTLAPIYYCPQFKAP